jgi:hypothetical protein
VIQNHTPTQLGFVTADFDWYEEGIVLIQDRGVESIAGVAEDVILFHSRFLSKDGLVDEFVIQFFKAGCVRLG